MQITKRKRNKEAQSQVNRKIRNNKKKTKGCFLKIHF